MQYNEALNVLIVTYQGGTVCNYTPVNPENYAGIVKSNCLSSALHKTIRNHNIVGVTSPRGH